MQRTTWLMVLKLCVAIVLRCTNGAMFHFHLIVGNDNNSTINEQSCKDLGYDGLAVVSSPEAYIYALKLTENVRNVQNKGTYIGIHYQAENVVTLWDDGTVPRSDSMFYNNPPVADPLKPYGRLDSWGMFRMGYGEDPKPALCGNHRNYPTESIGQTVSGELQTTTRTVLSTVRVLSYLECSILCGTLHECRAAEFNQQLLFCTLIGEFSSTGNTPNPNVLTYVRVSF